MNKLAIPVVAALMITLAEQADVKIVSIPRDNPGPDPCTLVCAGVARWNEGAGGWTNSLSQAGKVYRSVHTTECNFVSTPVVTITSAAADPNGNVVCPAVSVAHVRDSWFGVFSVGDMTKGEIMKKQCDVYWSASGFTC